MEVQVSEIENVGLFDLDSSLADFEKALLRDLRAVQSPDEPPLTGANLWEMEQLPHIRARMDLIKSVPGWWFKLQPILKGFAVYKLAADLEFRNEILTKGPRTKSRAWMEKVDWCLHHFGNEVDIHIVMNKGRVYGKFLYDDYPAYMDQWLKHRPRGLGIMPTTAQNADYRHPQVIKWDGRQETFDYIGRMLVRVRDRAPGEPLNLAE